MRHWQWARTALTTAPFFYLYPVPHIRLSTSFMYAKLLIDENDLQRTIRGEVQVDPLWPWTTENSTTFSVE